jgi:predicted RNase H-like nuclease (RuvC/YqgF family)
MVNKYELNKQFSNMGIDKESIMNIGKESNNIPQQKETKEEENQEIMLLKRKIEYLQSNILVRINERFDELEKKIDSKKNDSVDLNRELTSMRNDIGDLKKKLNSVRVIFGEEVVNQQVKTNVIEQKEERKGNPGNIKVEDYFNFSNKKFD